MLILLLLSLFVKVNGLHGKIDFREDQQGYSIVVRLQQSAGFDPDNSDDQRLIAELLRIGVNMSDLMRNNNGTGDFSSSEEEGVYGESDQELFSQGENPEALADRLQRIYHSPFAVGDQFYNIQDPRNDSPLPPDENFDFGVPLPLDDQMQRIDEALQLLNQNRQAEPHEANGALVIPRLNVVELPEQPVEAAVRRLLPGSPLRQEVDDQDVVLGVTTPPMDAGQRRTAEQAGLRNPQRRNVRPRRFAPDGPQLPFHRNHDDENGPAGGGVPA